MTLRELQVPISELAQQPSFSRILGGEGNDLLIGNDEDNEIDGNSGHDVIEGRAGSDTLRGMTGHDTIDGGSDNDVLNGDVGDDHYVFQADWGVDQLIDAGGLNDHMDFSAVQTGLTVQIGPLSVAHDANLVAPIGDVIERLTTGSGDDEIRFLHDTAQLAGGQGILDGGLGQDRLDYANFTAGAPVTVNLTLQMAPGGQQFIGFEDAVGGDGDDTLIGDAEDNQLEGGSGNDTIEGRAGNDRLLGGDDNDFLDGGTHDDELLGGPGNDTFRFGIPTPGESDSISEAANEGLDTVDLQDNGAAVLVDMTSDQWVSFANGGREISVGATDANLEWIVGTPMNDTFIVDGDELFIVGGDGDDHYVFPDGITNDTTLIESPSGGTDHIDFSAFTDSVTFDLSANFNSPAAGLNVVSLAPNNFEIVSGGEQGDILHGNLADNQLFGGAGDDVLTPSAGTNEAVGGPGDDTYVLDANSLINTITESIETSGGIDTLDFASAAEGVTLDMDDFGAQSINAAGTLLTLNGVVEQFVGTPFEDIVAVDAAPFPRFIDGGNPGLPAVPGDTLIVDGLQRELTIESDEILPQDFEPILYTNVETLHMQNADEITVDAGLDSDDGGSDNFELYRDATDTSLTVNGVVAFTAPVENAPHIQVIGSSDDDSLTVSFAAGSPIPSGLTYHGGGQLVADDLSVVGTGTETITYAPDPAVFGSGVLTVGDSSITFTGLEPVFVRDADSLILIPQGREDNLVVDSPLANQNRISGQSDGVPFEEIIFSHVARVAIDAAANDAGVAGNDRITFDDDLVASGLRSLEIIADDDVDVDAAAVTSFRVDQSGGSWSFTNPRVTGDLNDDELVNAADIDLLNEAVRRGNHEAEFDLTGDATVDRDDVLFLVRNILATYPGDANLDGQVDSRDLNSLALNWRATANVGWEGADFDGNGQIDALDLNTLALNWQRGVSQALSDGQSPASRTARAPLADQTATGHDKLRGSAPRQRTALTARRGRQAPSRPADSFTNRYQPEASVEQGVATTSKGQRAKPRRTTSERLVDEVFSQLHEEIANDGQSQGIV